MKAKYFQWVKQEKQNGILRMVKPFVQHELHNELHIIALLEAFYNSVHPHSGIGWIAPNALEASLSDIFIGKWTDKPAISAGFLIYSDLLCLISGGDVVFHIYNINMLFY